MSEIAEKSAIGNVKNGVSLQNVVNPPNDVQHEISKESSLNTVGGDNVHNDAAHDRAPNDVGPSENNVSEASVLPAEIGEKGGLANPYNMDITSLLLASGQLLRQHEDEHLWRKLYLQKSFYLVGTILYITFLIVILVGIGIVDLTDAVLMTILGTTVAQVVGILAIAFHWLYPRGSEKNNG